MQKRAWIGIGVTLALLALLPASKAQADGPAKLAIPRALRQAGTGATRDMNWLAQRQFPDGHWSAMNWDQWCNGMPRRPRPRLAHRTEVPHDLAVTALSLRSFVVQGYSHRGSHTLRSVVLSAANWLMRRQAPDGSFDQENDPDPLGAHALATLALVDLYGMTHSALFEQAAVDGINNLLARRGASGVWQRPDGSEDDILATTWATMALKSASLTNRAFKTLKQPLPFPTDATAAIERAALWFRASTHPVTGRSGATAAGRERGATIAVVTAASALVRFNLAGETPTENGSLQQALNFLRDHPPTQTAGTPTHDHLYAALGSLVAYKVGGRTWKTWKHALRTTVIEAQRRTNKVCEDHGSFDPVGAWSTARGRVGATALMAIPFSVWYRYDRVFGNKDGAGQRVRGRPRITLRAPGRTWSQASQPAHASRMRLAEGRSLPIDAAHIRSHIDGHRAQVVLDLFITSTEKTPREGVLDLRLPNGAAPYYLAFGEAVLSKVDAPGTDGAVRTDLAALHAARKGTWGEVLEARMAPVERATQTFEKIVRTSKDPALLTWSGAGMFKLRVFPLLPGKQHRIIVAYEVDLTPIGDDAELLLHMPTGVHDVRVAVSASDPAWTAEPIGQLEEGVRTWHEPGVQSIRISVRNPGDTWLVGKDAAGRAHTAAWVRPDVPKFERPTSPMGTFLIDVSDSVYEDHMEIWQVLVPEILRANRETLTTFRVGFFDMQTRWWREGPVPNTPENVTALIQALNEVEPGGATDVGQALDHARNTGEPGSIFLFTDGNLNWGTTAKRSIYRYVDQAHPVFAYATGVASENRSVLQAVASKSGGALIRVLGQADVPAAASAHRYRHWALAAITVPGLSDLLVGGNPAKIYPGQRLRLAARGKPDGKQPLALSLRHGDETRALEVAIGTPRTSPMAARAYGQAGVLRLEAKLTQAGPLETALATDYATHFRIVGRSCALLMLETKEAYTRAGLDDTGSGARAAATPILKAFAAAPREASIQTRMAQLASNRGLDRTFVKLLQQAPTGALGAPFAPSNTTPDLTLRALGTDAERDVNGALDRLASYAYGLGHPAHAMEALQRIANRSNRKPVHHWLLARAAADARRPLIAFFGYECALDTDDDHGYEPGEVFWVIALDYERYLKRFLATLRPVRATQFARARLASLRRWRQLMGTLLPPTRADLVVLHVPQVASAGAYVAVTGPGGRLTSTPHFGSRPSNLQRFPEVSRGEPLQLTVVQHLTKGPWSFRLAKRTRRRARHIAAGRSLIVVIRNWGGAREHVLLQTSLAPSADPEFLRLRR